MLRSPEYGKFGKEKQKLLSSILCWQEAKTQKSQYLNLTDCQREANYNLSFIWLTGGLKPDHKTIAEFRRKNKTALKRVLRQCARLCIKLGLIEGNTLFVDGSKFKANASLSNNWTKQRCEKYLKNIDRRTKEILLECEVADDLEKQQDSLVKVKDELKDHEALKSKVEDILNEIETQNKQSTNTTDPDSKPMRSRQGPGAGYNAQVRVDEEHGLIVNSDVIPENHDYHQFSEQIDQANEVLGKQCETACADAGYADINSLAMAGCFNIARMINIIGVCGLVEKLAG